jgi:hypothetical protein
MCWWRKPELPWVLELVVPLPKQVQRQRSCVPLSVPQLVQLTDHIREPRGPLKHLIGRADQIVNPRVIQINVNRSKA